MHDTLRSSEPQEVPASRAKRMSVYTEIEIAQTPEQVRHIFLDFPSFPTWTKGYIKSLTAEDPAMAPGSKLRAVLGSVTFSPKVLANSPGEFRWRGVLYGIPGIFTGEHIFVFEPSKATPGGTTFLQAEAFSGALSFLVAEGTDRWKTIKGNFTGFNEDLKKKCEEDGQNAGRNAGQAAEPYAEPPE